jgi:DNA-directed RNA polymerase specialized sigma24 family protein/tetratricopeptide (TPR) repeat protein
MEHLDVNGESINDPLRARELLAQKEQAIVVDALSLGNVSTAISESERLYGVLVGRYCLALLGDLALAQTLSQKVIIAALTQWESVKQDFPTLRSYLLLTAKKQCAIELMSPRETSTTTDARRLLSLLRPSERELLTLRFVSQLSHPEISKITSTNVADSKRRISAAIIEACYVTDPRILPSFTSEERKTFLEQLIDLIEGSAPTELRAIIAENDALRDELHVANQVVRRIAAAADDYQPKPLSFGIGGTQILAPIVPTAVVATSVMDANVQRIEPVIVAPVTPPEIGARSPIEPVVPVIPQPVPVAPEPVAAPPKDTAPEPVAAPPKGTVPEPVAGKMPVSPENRVALVEPLPKKSAWLVAGLAAAAVVVVAVSIAGVGRRVFNQESSKPVAAMTITQIELAGKAGRVEVCTPSNKSCHDASKGENISATDQLRTSGSGTAKLSLETIGEVTVEQDTEVAFDTEHGAVKLSRGRLTFDVTAKDKARLDVRTNNGRIEATRGKFIAMVEPAGTRIEVSRGSVLLANRDDQQVTVQAGQQGAIEGNGRPQVYAQSGPVQALAIDDRSSESADPESVSRGLGELTAKKPSETKERRDAVRLSKHHVSVRIVGAVAKTEIEEVFANDTNDVLEGVFRFPLPSDAQIERLALDVDGKLIDGAFVERERAAAIWRGNIVNAAPQMKSQIRDDIVWVPGPWRDPALLEWQRGNRFELKIYPIPKQGQRRIVLSYTQVLPEAFGRRQYSYPLPSAGHGGAPVNDFSVDVEIRNHDANVKPKVRGYAVEPRDGTGDVAQVRLSERAFTPKGDLGIEYALPNRERALQAWAYRPSDDHQRPYAAMLLRPKLPISQGNEARDFAFVVDTSRSMVGENLKRAEQLVSRVINELSPEDRLTVLACDNECRTWPEGLVSASASTRERAERWLSQWTAEGASDPAFSIESAFVAVSGSKDRRSEIIYVGDGTATVGAVRPQAIENYVRRVVENRNSQVTAIAIGSDSDLPSLRALARGGRGTLVPFVPGMRLSQASKMVLAAVMGEHLTDATLELPAGMTLENQLEPVIVQGSELVIPARMNGPRARGDVVLRGRVADQPFEQRYPIELEAIAGERHGFVPRLYAAARILELDSRNDEFSKKEAIELSRQFSVASRHTSLLVLESSAMFKAFGLDNERQAQTWSGELESESSDADAEGAQVSTAAENKEMSPGGGSSASGSPVNAVRAAPASSPMDVARGTSGSVARKASAAAPLATFDAEEAPVVRRSEGYADRPLQPLEIARPRPRPPVLVPMRRIWERKGEIRPGVRLASKAKLDVIASAEREQIRNSDRRSTTKQLFDLYVAANDRTRAEELAQRWNERDPLDVEAIVARADMAASRGDRASAIRILGSVVDVRPGDVGAQQRLARLYRWQGQEKTACRFQVALAAFRSKDEATLVEAMRCTQSLAATEPQFAQLRRDISSGIEPSVMAAVERLSAKERASDKLSGDLQLFAKWNSDQGVDLDLALIDPDGHRISWLGAPSRSVISALNVVSFREESLALRGGKPGEYIIELTRANQTTNARGPISGTLEVVVAGQRKTLTFELTQDTDRLGLVTIKQVPKLIPY